ncbi:MAG TPA: hypothetical protein VNZ50_14720 [Hyphomicrobiaceae bacterium]|nr:hypothetical protein [Hyphomicrobiaceae bacterium]
MDTALIVFTVGTAASFLPLYWLAIRFSRRWARPAVVVPTVRTDPPGRREFLDLLRREAASRAVAILHEALVEVRLTADHGHGALSAEMRRSLAETGRLVDSLFARELREKFRQGADALAFATSNTLGAASVASASAIAAFERALDVEPDRAPASARRAGFSGLLHKGREWIGMAGIRAAA